VVNTESVQVAAVYKSAALFRLCVEAWVLCHGVDGRPGESCHWQGVMAHPVHAQERLRWWWCSDLLFGDRLCEDSSVLLTRGRTGVQ
jgi:hypothetical protein